MEQVLFYVFAIITVFAAIMVVSRKNPVTSALFMVLCFFALAAIYVLLSAHLIAILQVLVYAGAIMVLVIFVIMLMNLRPQELGVGKKDLARIVGGALGALLVVEVLSAFSHFQGSQMVTLSEDFGTIEVVGRKLFTDFLLPFEIASVLLLVAIVGAVVLLKRRI